MIAWICYLHLGDEWRGQGVVCEGLVESGVWFAESETAMCRLRYLWVALGEGCTERIREEVGIMFDKKLIHYFSTINL